MGDVDVDNFTEQLVEKFQTDVANSSFIAIDLEMTGISFPNKSENGSDTVAFRYSKIRGVASTFGIIQVGVSVFNSTDKNATVYNFYVFPRPVTEGTVDSIPLVTLCSASTNFNKSHGMDFGRWINKGLTYVNGETEKKLRESLIDDVEAGNKAWDRFFGSWQADDSIKELEEYKSQEVRILQEVEAMINDDSVFSYKVPFVHGGQKWLKSIVATVREKFPQLRMVEEVSGGGSSRVLTKKSAEKIFGDYIGFRRVWNIITRIDKPVVFHNGFLDLVFCYQAFENELPNTLTEFKKSLRTLFPGGVFDTRLIAIESNLSMAGSAALETLGDMFAAKDITVTGSGKYDTMAMQDDVEHKFHEAGYDALLTGKVFLGLSEKLNNDVSNWKNCMCLSRCLWVLTVDDPDNDRLLLDCGVGKNRIVRILSDIRPKCSTRDILNHFDDLKTVVSPLAVNIQWTNDTSGLLLVSWTQPADKTVDAVTTALSSRMIELVKAGGPIGESVKLSSTSEYVKMQLEELSPDYIAAQKKFRV